MTGSAPNSAPKPSKLGSYAAFRHRDFRWFLATRTLFVMGQQMQTVAVGWHMYELTRRPIDLGYVGLALFLPQILFALPAGQLADRLDRRLVVIAGSTLCALCSALLLALPWLGIDAADPMFAVLFLYGTGRAFVQPATQSLLPAVVPRHDFANAMAWRSSTGQAAVIGGPALGGFLLGFGAGAVYAVVVVLIVLSMIAATALGARPAENQSKSETRSSRASLGGVRFVLDHPLLLGAISLDLFAVLFGGATAMLPVYARDILAVGPTGLGLLRSAPALGSVVCSIWMASHPLRRHAGPTMLVCVAGFGVAIIVFGLSHIFLLSLAALVCAGACDMVSVYVRQTIVQLGTPDSMRGRVNAVSLVFIGASNELGEFESGMTAAWFGTIPSVVLGGVGTIVVVALWTWRFAPLRRVDRLENTYPEPPR